MSWRGFGGADGIGYDGRAGHGVRRRRAEEIVAHVGPAHSEAELEILQERAREMLAGPAQGAFDLGI